MNWAFHHIETKNNKCSAYKPDLQIKDFGLLFQVFVTRGKKVITFLVLGDENGTIEDVSLSSA